MNRSLIGMRYQAGSLLTVLALAGSFFFSSCGGGSNSYDEPSATATAPLAGQTQNVLIDAATLKSMVDTGLVNNNESWEKVVILDVTTATDYIAGHIPGAQFWDSSNSGVERYEGPVLSSNMVLDGPTMDDLLQQYGIDENTTVVFAGAGNPGRIYFTFRYWGFPKTRLKVLNGWKKAWTTAGYELSTEVPAVTASTYSVRNLQFNPDVRAALNEVMAAAQNGTAIPLNALTGNTEVAGKTAGIFSPSAYCSDNTVYPYTEYSATTCLAPATSVGDYVVFQGTIQGAKHLGQANFYQTDATTGVQTVKSVDDIKALLASLNIDGSKPIITYCRAGNAAALAFLALDAALDYDVMVYDGSWSQWGSLTNAVDAAKVPDASYALPAQLSAWATDGLTTANTDGVTMTEPIYNVSVNKIIEKPTYKSNANAISENILTPTAAGANSIEIEDSAYANTPASGAPTGTSGASGGGC